MTDEANQTIMAAATGKMASEAYDLASLWWQIALHRGQREYVPEALIILSLRADLDCDIDAAERRRRGEIMIAEVVRIMGKDLA